MNLDSTKEEWTYNRQELGSEMSVLTTTAAFSKVVLMIQCFDFTFLREQENNWIVYLSREYPTASLTIPGLGTRTLFFLGDPYGIEYSIPLTNNQHVNDNQLLYFLCDYKLKYIMNPILLTNFDIANQYPDPVELLPYEKQWIHKSLNSICTGDKPINPDICLDKRDQVHYISDRLSTINFSRPIILKKDEDLLIWTVTRPRWKIENPNESVDFSLALWTRELAILNITNCVLSSICPTISTKIYSLGTVIETVNNEMKKNANEIIRNLIDSKLDDERQGYILGLYGPSFTLLKVPDEDQWILFTVDPDNPKFFRDLENWVEFVGHHHLKISELLYDLPYQESTALVSFKKVSPSVSTFLSQNGYYNEQLLSTEQVVNLLYSIAFDFLDETVDLLVHNRESVELGKIDTYMYSIVQSILNDPLPITEETCQSQFEVGLYLDAILRRFGKVMLKEPFQLAYWDSITVDCLNKLIDRLCRNQEYFTKFVIPLQEKQLANLVRVQ